MGHFAQDSYPGAVVGRCDTTYYEVLVTEYMEHEEADGTVCGSSPP